MNKAFVRDAEPTVSAVRDAARSANRSDRRRSMPLSAPRSGHNWARRPVSARPKLAPSLILTHSNGMVSVGQLVKPVYPKDPAAPICACFGFTSEEIEADVREGVATRTRALIERAKSSAARCSQMAANGQSCVPAVQRVFHEVPPALTPAG